jgi:hypothetical protein
VSGEPTRGEIQLCLAVEGGERPDSIAEAVLDPSRAPDETTSVALENVARIVRAHGGSRSASATGPDRWTALVLLPAPSGDDG